MTRPYPLRHHRVLCIAAALFCIVGIAAPVWAQFETRATQTVTGVSFGIAVEDFNHDGKLDVAIAGDGLSILLSNGDGTFKPPVNYQGTFYAIAAADFNNDGNLDLVVAPFDTSVSVFLGNGDGTFRSPISSPTTYPSGFIVAGDLNGDHRVDIVVIDFTEISVLLGNGDGTFRAPIDNNSFATQPQSLAVGDFNKDHRLDVVSVGSFGSSANIGVLLGNGDGTLQDALTSPLSDTPGSIAAADFDRDGNLDVAIGAYFADGTAVLLGNGDGSFQPPRTYAGGGRNVLVGDFNRDGKLDLIASSSQVPGAVEFLGNGDGTFQTDKFYPSGAGYPQAAGDLNGDQMPDLILLSDSGVTSMLNTGVVTFSPTSPIAFPTQLIGTTSAPLTATLTNNGSSPLTISSSSYSGAPFHMRTSCKGSIPPGGKCSVTATFFPQVEGAASGTVTIYDSASSKPQVVELIGTGTVVKLSSRQLTFPPQKTGTISPSQPVRLTNTGSTALNFTSIFINGPDFKDFSESNNCPTSLSAGASCTISVVFAPRKTGPLSDYIQITDSAGGSPQIVPLSGTGN